MANELKDIEYHSRKGEKLENIIRYVNKETLKEQHRKQRNGKASGIDKITKVEYGENLDNNIEELIKRMKSLSYRPKPVRRTYIPKANGKMRGLGIPSYEDKLVQGCMANILEEIYECKFLDCSFGFRKGRSCHQALREVNQTIMTKKVNYVLDCDIKGFFDHVDHEWLMKLLEHDIKDKVFLRYIKRFLISGYMEDMKYYESDKGTPQGGLISPILANVYLHYVLDLWFYKEVKPKLRGEAYLVRYCDDFIIMFQYENEAKIVYDNLVKRFGKFALEVAEDKTKIIPFGRYKSNKETFDFLGFMHFNRTTRTGKYTIGRKISKKKKKSKNETISKWLKDNRHINIVELINKLNKKLVGMYAYYGINGMLEELYKIYYHVRYMLWQVIKRRSQRSIKYFKLQEILEKFPIAKPKIYKDIWNWNV